jgi:LuxR family transcriptional regulator, maltose regulon positive regulatory protein
MPAPDSVKDAASLPQGAARRIRLEDELHPLAEAKLLAPRMRAGMVERPRIRAAFDAGEGGCALTLVAAPPGYGKTTAVRSWCATRRGGLAWVTLDRGDNDPVRFWRYIATGVDRVRSGLGQAALRRLAVAPDTIENAVIELMNGIAAYGDELNIVLDDFQLVTASECLESLDFALRNLPSHARLFMLTRADPALRLSQLRASGALTEIRTTDLAFELTEAHELLVAAGELPLAAAEVQILCDRTEGWPRALYLALLWLRGVGDPHESVREFGGNHRFVADYLNQELLGSLDDDSRWFLLRASVLGQVTAELCDGVFGRSDSSSLLRHLEQTNLLVARLEHGGWFRVHSLVGEFAKFHLAAAEPGAGEAIHRQAAVWFRARGLAVEAVEHAASAGDKGLVAEILEEHHLQLIRSGQARMLLRWTRTLPESELVAHPELAMAGATSALILGNGTIEKRRLLQTAERSRREQPWRFSPYVEAGMGMVRSASVEGRLADAVEEGRRAVEIGELHADDVLVASLAGYAQALYFSDAPDEAWDAALRAVQNPEAERWPTAHALARSTLALVALEQEHRALARGHAEKAKAIIGRVRSSRSWIGANASAALASMFMDEGRLVEAEREFVHAEHFFRDEVATVHHVWSLLLLSRVRCRRGKLADARAALEPALEELAALPGGGRLAALAPEVGRELELASSAATGGQVLDRPSEAEFAVLKLLASDLSAREIGRTLFLSPNTIGTHTRVLYRKLGVNSRAEAVARASSLGLLEENGI